MAWTASVTFGCSGSRSGSVASDSGLASDAAAAGGRSGDGGTFGSGGGNGSGGSGGDAGSKGSGGRLGTGGALGTGGSLGTGGAPGTGGAHDGGISDGGVSDAATAMVCPVPVSRGMATASSTCSISSLVVDPATVCAGSATCPIGKAYALRCSSFGYGPWLAPSGTTGASILLATNNPSTQIFTIGAGATARVDDVPMLTKAIHSLGVDRSGTRTIFTSEQPALSRYRETANGWSSDDASTVVGTDQALLSEGRAIDDTHAFAAYHNLGDYFPRLARRNGACWQSTVLANTPIVSMGMDIDATDRPWVAWIAGATNGIALSLVSPDGTTFVPWSTTKHEELSFWDRPIVLAGGLTGTSPFPALATLRSDGLHVVTPDADTAVWTDRIVPGSARAGYSGNCPGQVSTGAACQGLTTCSGHIAGALPGFGMVRTASGRAYAAWLEVESDTTYSLALSSPSCTTGGPIPCMCLASPTSTNRTMTMVVARVNNAATPSSAIRRFPLDTAAALPTTFPQIFSLVLAARGNTLLAVASVTSSPEHQLRYYEIDSAQLP